MNISVILVIFTSLIVPRVQSVSLEDISLPLTASTENIQLAQIDADMSVENLNENMDVEHDRRENNFAQILAKATSNVKSESRALLRGAMKAEIDTMSGVEAATGQLYDFVSQIHVKDANTRVSQAYVIFLLVFSIASILGCCCMTTFCVRAARDSNIAVAALNIRRQQLRHFQLQALIKEKMMVEYRTEKILNGGTISSSMSSDQTSNSQAENSQEDSSSYVSESNE